MTNMNFGTGKLYLRASGQVFPIVGIKEIDFTGICFDEKPKIISDDIIEAIFNDPATIIKWKDGTKTIVKCQPGDKYDKEAGLALSICKKVFGNKGNYNEVFKKWVD